MPNPDPAGQTVCFVDNGLFVGFARTIAKGFKHAFYWSPWQSAFPSSLSLLPGDGFPELERVIWLWDAIEKSDLVVVMDVYFGDLTAFLRKQGIPVWGAGKAEWLELNRWKAKQELLRAGQPVNHAELITGTADLRKYLEKHDNVWVKVSLTRGDMETFLSETYDLISPRIDELEYRLGARKTIAQFVVEDSIDDAVEVGYDGYTVDGKFPVRSFCGFEIKDLGFIGRVAEYAKLPKFIRDSNAALAPIFHQGYRGWYSNELRVLKSGKAYLIDPCCRLPSPPNEIEQEIFSNWPAIVSAGAAGECLDPKPVALYGIAAMLHCSWATKNWLPLKFPTSAAPFIKLRNHCRIDGVDYFVPQVGSELPEIGAVIGLGETIESAVEHLTENASDLKAYGLEIKLDAIPQAIRQIEQYESWGYEFSEDPLPEESALQEIISG